MKTQSGLLKDMIEKAKSFGYTVKSTEFYIEFYKDGILRVRVRKFYVDYTIDKAVYDRQMAKIK